MFADSDYEKPRLSPNGKFLAYLAPTTENGVYNIFVRTVGENDDRQVTAEVRSILEYRWQGNRHLLWIRDNAGDENWHLMQTNVDSGRTYDLTPFDKVTAHIIKLDTRNYPREMLIAMNARIQTGVGCGASAGADARANAEPSAEASAGANNDRSLFHIYRVNLVTRTLVLDTENPGDVCEFRADHQMQVRVAQVVLPDGGIEIRTRDTKADPWRAIFRCGPEDNMFDVCDFSPADDAVWVYTSKDAKAVRFAEINLSTGEIHTLAGDEQFAASGQMIHPLTRKLEAVGIQGQRLYFQFLSKEVEEEFAFLRALLAGTADLWVEDRDDEDNLWIVRIGPCDASVRYYLYDRSRREVKMLFASRGAVDEYALAWMQPISFTARDGMELYGYITVPKDASGPMPLVIMVHGGPNSRDYWCFHNEVQWLVNRGYVVLQINYRGSVGYTKDYAIAGRLEHGRKVLCDILDGKQWAVQNVRADPDRVAIYGWSYGGYTALTALSFTPSEFRCGVDIFGMCDLGATVRRFPPYWSTWKATVEQIFGTDPELLQSQSPLYSAHQIVSPLLVAQGANDIRVLPEESDKIVSAIREQGHGNQVSYLLFPDEGHGFVVQRNRMMLYAAIEKFLHEHLGGRLEPASPEDSWDEVLR